MAHRAITGLPYGPRSHNGPFDGARLFIRKLNVCKRCWTLPPLGGGLAAPLRTTPAFLAGAPAPRTPRVGGGRASRGAPPPEPPGRPQGRPNPEILKNSKNALDAFIRKISALRSICSDREVCSSNISRVMAV